MGRGRQKAKHTKVARELKYFSPDTNYSALERELSHHDARLDEDLAKWPEYDDEYTDRYATEDEEDCHGGSVTLVGIEPLTGLRSGQAVRVEGQLIDPHKREPSAPYRVQRLRPLP